MGQAETVQTSLWRAAKRLKAVECDTPQLDAELLLAHSLNENRTWLYMHPDFRPTESRYHHFLELVTRREQREPVAYIVGHKAFYGLEFVVDQAVLIPRPETELLVESALEFAAQYNRKISIVDIGTGSGCIAVTLAKELSDADIVAIDISDRALGIARQNAAGHKVSDRISFQRGNLLSPLTGPVDLMVSNPPYVSRIDLQPPRTAPEVNQFEPGLALDGGQDGLDIIKQLLAQAKDKLNPNGSLLVEIGSDQGQAVRRLAKTQFPNAVTVIKQDLAGLDRLLSVKLR